MIILLSSGKTWYQSFRKRNHFWLLSFILSSLFFLTVHYSTPVVFFINDDENILYSLAGYYTNGSPADHSFVNYVLGSFIRMLYRAFPILPWYGIYHVLVLFLSIAVLNRCILKAGQEGNCLFFSYFFLIIFHIVLYLYMVILMQFTTTSALAGTAAIALIFLRDGKNSALRVYWCDTFLSILLLLLCYMHRKNSGYVIFCFYFLVYGWQLACIFRRETGWIRFRALIMASCGLFLAIVLLGSVMWGSNAARGTDGWNFFYQYDTARYRMTDYPHDTYEENPELYQQIRWNESLYTLAGETWWFFMDERINVDSYSQIAQTGFYDTPHGPGEMIRAAKNLLKNDSFAGSGFFLFCFSSLLAAINLLGRKKRNWLSILLILCCFGGALLQISYLCLKDRFILRAFHVILLPATVIMTLCFLVNTNEWRYSHKKMYQGALAFVCAYCLVVLSQKLPVFYSALRQQAQERVEISQNTLEIERYAMEHPDRVYVYDTGLTFRYLPFITYTGHYPSNLFFWGGMGWNSPTFFEQLSCNQMENLYSPVFFQENVYYITRETYMPGGLSMRERFETYLEENYGNFGVQLEEILGNGISVYQYTNEGQPR